jgi:hypothetical protein
VRKGKRRNRIRFVDGNREERKGVEEEKEEKNKS